MTEYILSIVSVILLTGAVGIILPEGKTGKFIKSVFAVATLVVILTPLINLKGQEVPAFGGNDDVVYDEGYLDYIDYEKSESMSDTLEKMLKDEGYESLVQVYYERVDNKFKVTKVLIFCKIREYRDKTSIYIYRRKLYKQSRPIAGSARIR